MEKMSDGPLTGSFVCDIRVSVYDGKMHPVDSNDISFKIAGMMAFKDAFHQAQPQLMEPVCDLEAVTPEDMMGEIMTALQPHRSIINGMESDSGRQVVKHRTPQAALAQTYASLRTARQGEEKLNDPFAYNAPLSYKN